MATTPADLRAAALSVAAGLDPDTMSGTVAARAVQDLSVAEKAVATARMFVALRVAKTDAWRGQGHKSAADWLAGQCGITISEAHRQLGTAAKAKNLSKTKKAMDEGKLSPGQADAVTDGATADPDAEEDLLSAAENDTTKNLKDKAARTRAAATDSKERQNRVRRERCMRMRTDADGAFNLWLKGPAIDGARLATMLKPFQEEAFRAARTRWSTKGTKDTFDNREYDAFFNLFEHLCTLAAITTHLTRTNSNPKSDASTSPTTGTSTGPDTDTDSHSTTGTSTSPAQQHQPEQPDQPDSDQPRRSDSSDPDSSDRSSSPHPEDEAPSNPGPQAASGQPSTDPQDPVSGSGTTDTRASGPSGPPADPVDDSTAPPPGEPPDSPQPAPPPRPGSPPTPGDPGSDPPSPGSGPPDYGSGLPDPGQLDEVLAALSPTERATLTRRLPGGNNTKVIINIDLAALRRGHTLTGETCEITGLGPIAVEVAKQLMNDAFIATVIRDGTHIHTVTHHGRSLNAHQRTAIEATGLRCTNIACNHTIAIQIDHNTPWTQNPVTELANQDPLCPQCHRQKTHHDWHLEPGTGPRRLLPPHRAQKQQAAAEPAPTITSRQGALL